MDNSWFARNTPSDPPTPAKVIKWEHLALTHEKNNFDAKLAKQVNELGDKGWQLVDVSNVIVDGSTKKTIFCFKRQK